MNLFTTLDVSGTFSRQLHCRHCTSLACSVVEQAVDLILVFIRFVECACDPHVIYSSPGFPTFCFYLRTNQIIIPVTEKEYRQSIPPLPPHIPYRVRVLEEENVPTQEAQTAQTLHWTTRDLPPLKPTKMMLNIFGFLVLGLLVVPVTSYSSGLVSIMCDTMTPRHGTNSPQTTTSPYSVSASNYSFSPGDIITVTLEANNDEVFKGFFLQARSVLENNIVGYFTVTNSTSQTLNCNNTEDSAVSHTSSAEKSNITALWTAPPIVGDVYFRATFVQAMPRFWVGVQSPILTVIASSSPSSVSTTGVPSTSAIPSTSSSITTINVTTSAPSTHSVASSPPPTHISASSCGTQKVCFNSPSNCDPFTSISCFFMSSAMVAGGGYQFEISGPSDGYVGIGFSDDQIMGNDDIYICGMKSDGSIGIQHLYSEGRSRPKTLDLINVEISLASFTSGVIQCSFISRNNISTQSPLKQARSANSSYYILMAYGASNNGEIRYHGTSGRLISDSKIDLSVYSNVTNDSSGLNPLIKAHGSLMLIAWMTTGSLGMIFARYMKVAASQLVFGKAAWFQAHIGLMVLTVTATIASFVLVFVKVLGWSHNASTHAIIGCIVMTLVFFQPLIAVFRPSPENSRRFIFNWFHAINALLIKVLAVVNLFLGLDLINGTSGWLVNVMGGFLGWGALNMTFFEINAVLARKDMKKVKDLDDNRDNPVKYELPLLFIYLCGNLAFLIALLVGIGQS
ncbi:putative ferric-chelate reductase 1 [Pelodytes ibericus]